MTSTSHGAVTRASLKRMREEKTEKKNPEKKVKRDLPENRKNVTQKEVKEEFAKEVKEKEAKKSETAKSVFEGGTHNGGAGVSVCSDEDGAAGGSSGFEGEGAAPNEGPGSKFGGSPFTPASVRTYPFSPASVGKSVFGGRSTISAVKKPSVYGRTPWCFHTDEEKIKDVVPKKREEGEVPIIVQRVRWAMRSGRRNSTK